MTAWKSTSPGRLSSVFDILDALREALQWVTDPDVRERAEALLLREGWCDDLEEMGARLMADEAAQPPTIDVSTMSACVAFVHHMGGTSGLTDGERHVLLRCAEMMPSTVAEAMMRKAERPKATRMWPLPEGITACWQTYGHPERWGVYAWLGDNDGFLFTEKLGRDIPGLEGDAVWNLKSLIARRNIEDPPSSQQECRPVSEELLSALRRGGIEKLSLHPEGWQAEGDQGLSDYFPTPIEAVRAVFSMPQK